MPKGKTVKIIMNQPHLSMVHFQLTKRCNLNCTFCGQCHSEDPHHLALDEWLGLLDQLKVYAPQATVVLWGGEPLLYPHIETVVRQAIHLGFPLEIITNGTLIHRYPELLARHFRRIYLSIDGPEPIHDAIRGTGTFSQVRRNLELLSERKGQLIMMSVLTPDTWKRCSELPYGLPVDQVILHQLIYLSEADCAGHAPDFGLAWRKNAIPDYEARWWAVIEGLRQQRFPIPVVAQPHFPGGQCREPWRHLHIGTGGETSFCTDFTEQSLGNVRQQSIQEIFEGPPANDFRQRGNDPFCRHCAWKNTPDTVISLPCQRL